MTVQAIDAAASQLATPPTNASSWLDRMRQSMTPVAKLFGESPQQLMTDLQSGSTSLASLAQSKGVSQADLVSAIKSGLAQTVPSGAAQPSDSQLTNLANTIATRVHRGHHHHHGGGAGGVGGATDPAAAAALAALGALGGNDSDGDNDGSAASGVAATGSSASTTSALSPAQLDVQRLLFDLRTMAGGDSTTTSASAAGAGQYADASVTSAGAAANYSQAM